MNALLTEDVAAVRGERVALPDGVRPATVSIRDGRIVTVGPIDSAAGPGRVIDAGAHLVLPGLVDTHVHINDPGRTDWEGFDYATRAAAAGGVTTLVDMPLNSIPPTIDVAALESKWRAARGRCWVDVGFWGGVVPGNSAALEPLARAGVFGFKCFLCPSGVDEFQHVTEPDLREALPVVSRLELPLLAHAELPALLTDPGGDPRAYATWLTSRPAASEHAAIDLLVDLAREFSARVHIVHLASADAVPIVMAARANGLAISVETCPHYLIFAAEDIPNGAPEFKCAPPIRERSHRERLWDALVAGSVDFIATDHSPAPPAVKQVNKGDFVRAWGGIASLQLGLAAVWTSAAARGLSVERLPQWLAAGPAHLAGLEGVKGSIAPGRDADLVIWDPDAYAVVDPAALLHHHPLTPYAGMRLRGRVRTTILRGEAVFHDGECRAVPTGRLLARSSG